MPTWLEQGPDSSKVLEKSLSLNGFKNQKERTKVNEGLCTLVANETLIGVLKDILVLIHNNLGVEGADWMRRIARELTCYFF